MSIRTKTLIIITAFYLCSFAVLYVIGRHVFLGSYNSLQLADATQKAIVAKNTVGNELTRLIALTSDYGAWTDTYKFIEGTNPDYAKVDLFDLHISVILLMDVQTRPKLALRVDERTGTIKPCPIPLIKTIQRVLRPRSSWDITSFQYGVLDAPGGPLMIAVHSVLKNNHLGPQMGYCVIGRYLDKLECERISNQLELSISLHRRRNLPAFVNKALEASLARPAYSYTESDTTVAAYAKLATIGDGAPMVIKIRQPRSIYLQGKNSFNKFLAILLLAGVVVLVAVSIAMENIALRHLRRLSDEVVAIGEGKDISLRIRSCKLTSNQNEIDKLSTSINSMLSVLEQAEQDNRHIAEWGEMLLSSMTAAFPLAFLLVDNRTDEILYVNKQFCQIWGIDELENDIRSGKLKNNDVIPYCIPLLADVEAFAESCKPLQNEYNRIVVEDEIPFVDGRTIRRFSSQMRGDGDKYFGRIYVFEDVTVRKKSQQYIFDSESRTRAVLDNVQTGILITDAETHQITDANPSLLRMIGASNEDIVDLLYHNQICMVDEEVSPVTDLHQQIHNTEGMLICFDGSLLPVLRTAATVSFGGKDYVLESFVDISVRKQAEDDIRKRDLLLMSSAKVTRVLLEQSDFSMAITDAVRLLGESTGVDRVYIFENSLEPDKLLRQRTEWTRYGVEPQIDNIDLNNVPYYPHYARIYEMLSLNQLVTGLIKDFPDAERPILEAQNIKSILLVPILLEHKFWGFIGFDDCYDERVWGPGETSVLQIAANNIGSALARKLWENKLQKSVADLHRSNQDLEQFAYVASHDLQEPLRMVSSYVELLAKRYQGQLDERADRYIKFASDGATQMLQLINDLLTYSRAGLGDNRSVVSMEQVFDDVLVNLKEQVNNSGASVTSDTLPMVLGDHIQLVQLLQNLIGNAIKFRGSDAPRIHISAERMGNEWVFGVRDNGIGIDSKYAEKVFVIFQRLHTNTEYPGTGIGLAVCKKIVERLGGRIWISSQQEQGVTVFFTIPDQGGTDQQ